METIKVIEALAREFNISREAVLEQSLRTFLETKLQEIKAEILQLTGKYGISSSEEMEERYQQGTLEEADTWRDFQKLDHLEYKRDQLSQLLQELG